MQASTILGSHVLLVLYPPLMSYGGCGLGAKDRHVVFQVLPLPRFSRCA